MEYEWDEAKRKRNIEKHGIDFLYVLPLFVNNNAISIKDNRQDYGEIRYILLGEITERLFHVAYTIRGSVIRIISARKGNTRERRIYEKYTK
jgi:Uncharacterized protein conserved in bacteria